MTGIRFFEELGSELERAARQAPAPGRRGWRVPVGGVAVLSSTLVAVVVAVGAIVLLSHTRTTHPVGTAKPSDAQAFVDRWRPRIDEMNNARHAKMLRVILGETLEQKRFFDQALAGRQDLLGRRGEQVGPSHGEVLSSRWIE